MKELFDIIDGTLLGDTNIRSKNGKGKIIKQRREKLGISREYINKKLNVGEDYIRKIEYGMRFPSIMKLRKILNILDIDLFYLLENFK